MDFEKDECKNVLDIIVEAARMMEMLKYCVQTNEVLLVDNKTLHEQLTSANSLVEDLEVKLKEAQKLYYGEKQKVTALIKEKTVLMTRLEEAKDIVMEGRPTLAPSNEALPGNKLETILELDNTDYLMSDLSYTLDEEDMSAGSTDVSLRRGQRHKRAPSRLSLEETEECGESKKTKGQSSTYTAGRDEQVIATTTVTVPHNGPVTATSVIETLPPLHHMTNVEIKNAPSFPSSSGSESAESGETVATPRVLTCRSNLRMHNWIQRSRIMGEACSVCLRKIKFSSASYKCTNCKAIVHTNCRDEAPLPCVPVTNTPNVKSSKIGAIGDFVPESSPMIPAIVIHCIREIESRGLNEVGLYRVPGSDKEVKNLKEKLVKAKGVVQLSDIPDINTVCGCLKEFLRSLKENLIPKKKWKEFAAAAEILNGEERKNRLLQSIQSLPQPNRDTLSYIVLHLQKVAASHSCKMPVTNLSKMFGPTIVGYSKQEPDNILIETNISNKIMAEFLLLPTECWEELLYQNNSENVNLGRFFSDSNSNVNMKRRKLQNFFNTP